MLAIISVLAALALAAMFWMLQRLADKPKRRVL